MATSKNTIIELSNRNATKVLSNAEYETCFNPIPINNGDIITIKNVFVDTIQQTYDQIYIDKDLPISMTFCFYYINQVQTYNYYTLDYVNWAGFLPHNDYGDTSVRIDGDYNFARLNNDLFKKTITFTLKAGVYSPESLAKEISTLMTSVSFPYSRGNEDTNDWTGYNFLFNPTFVIGVIREGGMWTDSKTNNAISNMEFVQRSQVDKSYLPFNQSYQLISIRDNGSPEFMLGARQVALVFNQDNNLNKFAFQYLHTPSTDVNGVISVGWNVSRMQLGINGDWYYTFPNTKESGIIFTDLQPASFWSSLGFDLDKILLKYNVLQNGIQLLNFDPLMQTTEALMTIDDLFAKPYGMILPSVDEINNKATDPPGGPPTMYSILKASSITRSLSASQFYSFKPLSPYIIVELVSNFQTDYRDSNNSRKFINAIVSRNYTQNNYITGYSDVSVEYQHTGESFMLSNITVRFLDPLTQNVMTDLSTNNYVLLQILKQ